MGGEGSDQVSAFFFFSFHTLRLERAIKMEKKRKDEKLAIKEKLNTKQKRLFTIFTTDD